MKKGIEIYPKTKRMKVEGEKVQLTEKLDGSNLVIFKKNGELHFAQRKNIYALSELDDAKDLCYNGLYNWAKDWGKILEDNIHEGSAICGEWLGAGSIKYKIDDFDKRFYIFAKANINDDYSLSNLIYDHDLFIYPFIDEKIPPFIGIVPVVADINVLPNKKHLDSLYEKYKQSVGGRDVEGFVINYNNIICKYVRMKHGRLVEYSDNDHKGA